MIPEIHNIVLSKFDDIFELFAGSFLEKIHFSKLLVIDDGLSNDIKEKYSDFFYLPSPKPFGACLSINLGMRETDPFDVIIWNDDIRIITENIDIILGEWSLKRPDLGILAPISTNVMNEDQLPQNRTSEPIKETKNDIGCGCGTYYPRKIIREIGFFDEAYAIGIGGREDRDYCERIKRKGYKFGIVQECEIEHGGGQFDNAVSNTHHRIPGQLAKAKLNREYFKQKWGLE